MAKAKRKKEIRYTIQLDYNGQLYCVPVKLAKLFDRMLTDKPSELFTSTFSAYKFGEDLGKITFENPRHD